MHRAFICWHKKTLMLLYAGRLMHLGTIIYVIYDVINFVYARARQLRETTSRYICIYVVTSVVRSVTVHNII